MTLQDVLQAVDRMSPEERRQVQEHLEAVSAQEVQGLAELAEVERIFAELREGFTADDLEELAWAINVEHVESVTDKE